MKSKLKIVPADPVIVEELGFPVFIRRLTFAELRTIKGGTTEDEIVQHILSYLCLALCKESGEPLADEETINGWDNVCVQELFKAASAHNNRPMTTTAEAKKN